MILHLLAAWDHPKTLLRRSEALIRKRSIKGIASSSQPLCGGDKNCCISIYRGGGGDFAAGLFRRGIFGSGFIWHAVLNLLWEIPHPHAVSRPLVGGGCCDLLMLCRLSPRGLLFLS